MKKLIALSIVSISLVGCGIKIEEPSQIKPASNEAKIVQQECLAKSEDGKSIYTEYGTCINYVPAPTTEQKQLKTDSVTQNIVPIKPIIKETLPAQEQTKPVVYDSPKPIQQEKQKTIVHKEKQIKIPTAKEIQKTKKQPVENTIVDKEELKPIERVSIESIMSTLNSTKISIKTPNNFNIGKPEVINVLVENKKQVEKAKVLLTANIIAQGMLITKLEANSQPLTISYPAKWVWELEAETPGEYRVIVNLYAKITTEDGQEVERFIASQRKDIEVKESIYKRVGNIAIEYWYIWLALIAATYGFLKRKKNTPE